MTKEGKSKESTSRKPPSRVRYEQSHPVVSFRIEREYYEQLMVLLEKSNKSIGDFFREALAAQLADTDLIYNQGATSVDLTKLRQVSC